MPGDELPPLNTKLTADIGGLADGLVKGTALVQEFKAAISAEFGNGGVPIGERLGSDIGDGIGRGIQDADPGEKIATSTTERLRDERSRFISAGQDVGAGLGDGLTQGVDPGLDDLDTKIKDRTRKTGEDAGKSTGQGFAAGASPLMLGAFGLAATAGPAVLLGATAAAVIGAGALVTKGNAELAGSYQQLGSDASQAIQDATRPLIPALLGSLQILDQGVGKTGDELTSAFQTAAPFATEITSGMLSLVDNAVPGLTAGLKDAQPYAHEIADDLGKLGTGVGDFFKGLGSGAQGGASGLDALVTTAEHLLGDVGQIAGALSNGLGPALHDVESVAVPVAGALTAAIKAVPPAEVRAAADAVAALFAAFQLAKLTGAVQEGATFLSFVKGSKVAATEAEGAISGMAVNGVGKLSTAMSVATGPLGLIIGGAGLLGSELDNLYKSSHDVMPSIDGLATGMQNAAQGSGEAQDEITHFAQAIQAAPFNLGAEGLKNIDGALNQLQQSDPQSAATEFYQIQMALEAQGKSAGDVAKMFPQYEKALTDAKLASQATVVTTNSLGDALQKEADAVGISAQQTSAKTLADLGARDGANTLTSALYQQLIAYQQDTTEAGAYKTALDATFGKFQSYSESVANFTTDLSNANGQLTRGKDAIDLHTAAGSKNFTVLSNLATANENVAESLLKQTGDQDAANKSLQTGALKIDALAKSAGWTDGQIAQLNKDLYGTANIGDIHVTVGVDTKPAYNGVGSLVRWINGQAAHVSVTARGPANSGGAVAAFDDGGWVNAPAGAPVPSIVHGQEYVLSQDMLAGRQSIDPRALASLRAAMAGAPVGASAPGFAAGGAGGAGGGSGGQVVPVAVNVYIDGQKLGGSLNAGVRASVQQFARHNSLTGYAGNYQ